MKFVKIYGLGLILVFISCQSQQTGEQFPSVKFLTSDSSADLPFSEAVCVGDRLILSGQIGIDPESRHKIQKYARDLPLAQKRNTYKSFLN